MDIQLEKLLKHLHNVHKMWKKLWTQIWMSLDTAIDTERDMGKEMDKDSDSKKKLSYQGCTCSFSSLCAAFSNSPATSFN